LVTGADVVAPLLLEVSQEPDDPLECKIAEDKPGGLAPVVRCDEEQERPDCVAIASHRGWPQSLHRDEVMNEKRSAAAVRDAGIQSRRHLLPRGSGEGLETAACFLE